MNKLKKTEPPSFASDELPKVEFIPEAGADFVVTPYIRDLTERALAYLTVGYAVHLCGPAGTGKSTLALHIASQLGRPCTLLHGDDEFKASDLLGRDTGYHRSSTVDNYVSSIVKTEETLSVVWSNNRLTTACQKGHTLIYDEFTRSPATANNPFLSILEEGILNIPSSGKQKGYIKVHDNFRAIFTSNPEEYVGVHKTQDALLDRMITMRLDYQDRETETAIVQAKSEQSTEDAAAIVDIVRAIRNQLGGSNGPTVRAAIAIARILDFRNSQVDPQNAIFITTCEDVLFYHTSRQSSNQLTHDRVRQIINCLGQEIALASETTLPIADSSAHNIDPTTSLAPQTIETSGSATQVEADPAEESSAVIAQADQESTDDVSPAQPSERSADVERELLETTKELSETLDKARLKPEDSLTSFVEHLSGKLTQLEPIATPSTASLSSSLDARASSLPKPPSTMEAAQHDTASPQQMLEAAVSRFLRPPKSELAGSTIRSMHTDSPYSTTIHPLGGLTEFNDSQ